MSSDRASWHTGARTQGATCKEPRVARHCCRRCAVLVVCRLPREERGTWQDHVLSKICLLRALHHGSAPVAQATSRSEPKVRTLVLPCRIVVPCACRWAAPCIACWRLARYLAGVAGGSSARRSINANNEAAPGRAIVASSSSSFLLQGASSRRRAAQRRDRSLRKQKDT